MTSSDISFCLTMLCVMIVVSTPEFLTHRANENRLKREHELRMKERDK